jgi:hypothetical protein
MTIKAEVGTKGGKQNEVSSFQFSDQIRIKDAILK